MFFLRQKRQTIRKENGSLPRLFYGKVSGAERISPSAFVNGSLTIEAAFVMPIFLCCILSFFWFFQIINTAGAVNAALKEDGKKLALYAYVTENGTGEGVFSLGDRMTLSLAKVHVRQAAGDSVSYFHMSRSSAGTEDDMVDLVAEYGIRWKMPFLPGWKVRLLGRARVRAWTGRSREDSSGGASQEEIVYITENGTVYHRSRECSHIRLSIRTASRAQVATLRNQDGAKYYPCEYCGKRAGRLVYLTKEGNRYHSTVSCSGLKRGVLAVPLSQVADWPACSRCGG
jgi:hypothetical protein